MSEHLNRRITTLEEKVRHLESLSAPWQEKKAGYGPKYNPASEGDSAPGELAPLKDEKIKASPKNAYQPKNPWYKTLEGWYYFFAIFGIPFAIAYAIVTYLQWRDLRSNFRTDQRAWLTRRVDRSPPVFLELGKRISLDVVIANIGKTPARNLNGSVVLDLLDSDQNPSFDYSGDRPRVYFTNQLIVPGDSTHVGAHVIKRSSIGSPGGDVLTDNDVKQFSKGALHAVIHGKIYFDDIFSHQHWYSFCEYLEGGGRPAPATGDKICSEQNGTDNDNQN